MKISNLLGAVCACLVTLFTPLIANAASVTVNYSLNLDYVEGEGFDQYYGQTATASITYDLEAIGSVHPSFPFITVYQDAITNYSVTSLNQSSGFQLLIAGGGSDIQITDSDFDGTGSNWDRFRSPGTFNGSSNIPQQTNDNEVGIEIDQLFTRDTFGSMELPETYPTALGDGWDYFFIHLDGSGQGKAQYTISNVSVVTTVPIPGAIWLFGSGLIGLIGVARRKKV